MKNLVLIAFIISISLSWDKPMPKLFLIGDSISIRYTPYLREYLTGTVQFERKQDDGHAEKNLDIPTGTNGGDSRMVLAYLKTKMKDPAFKPNYLLLNCGLHDIKRDTLNNKAQVEEKEYRENLEAIIQIVKNGHIQLIWIRTTPVVDSIHNAAKRAFNRYSVDVQTYNKIADEVCAENHIPMIDLFSFTQLLGAEQFSDHVHYKESACALQAAFIAGFLRCYISHSGKF